MNLLIKKHHFFGEDGVFCFIFANKNGEKT